MRPQSQFPHSCILWAIYIFPPSVHLFSWSVFISGIFVSNVRYTVFAVHRVYNLCCPGKGFSPYIVQDCKLSLKYSRLALRVTHPPRLNCTQVAKHAIQVVDLRPFSSSVAKAGINQMNEEILSPPSLWDRRAKQPNH